MPAYNNYYPATYQPPVGYPQYQQASMPQMQMPQTSQMMMPQMSMASNQRNNSGIEWVQGKVGAKAYPVAPNNSVMLMDPEEPRFYIKSTDASGMPMPLRIFSYTEEVESQQSHDSAPIDTSKFITREEFEELEQRMMNRQQKVDFKKEKQNG